ncbi:MAG: caspase family protein [Saprospiraceae bacterium]|nr:caspase family protein [Saprospiraceae bacterium]
MNNIIEFIKELFANIFGMAKKKSSKSTPKKESKPANIVNKPQQKRSFYALMVAIDRYAAPVPALRGCVNDRDALKDYLERQFADAKDIDLKIKTLTDSEATKKGIVEAFSHFDKAQKDDVCLFYYSGHGSQSPAPKEFWHLDPDGMNESLVCYDSRSGAKDLMDKELSYLIWKATNGRDVHFVSIFDCCNSGTITRNSTMTARQTAAAPYPTRFQEYVGHENYKITQQSGLNLASPPRGRYVQFSACKEQETAKEMQINGQTRGLFTYNLVAVLEQSGGNLTYNELQQILQLRVGNAVRDQLPQLISTESNDKNQRFLGGVMPPADPSYLIQFNKGIWTMNAGLVQGIPAQGGTVGLEDGSKVKLAKVNANNSEVDGMGNRDTNKTFKAYAKGLPFKQIKITFAPNTSTDGARVLSKTFKKYPSTAFDIVNDTKEAQYWIRCVDNSFQLTLPDDERPLFRRVKDYSEPSAIVFISHTERVAKWRNLLELSNPKTSIKDSEVEIQLYRISDPGNYEDNSPSELVDWRDSNVYRYELKSGEWQQPALRLRVRNKSNRTLYFSTLNLMDNFAIDNRFMPYQELASGTEAWLLDVFQGNTYQTIPLSIDDSYHSWGITEAKEYFKIIISTDQFLKTENYNQEGLELDINPEELSAKRAGRTSSGKPEEPDWTTREIEMIVVRPLEAKTVEDGRTVELMESMKVTAPRGMSASITLTTVTEAERALSKSETFPELTFSPAASRGGANAAQPFEFTSGNHNSPGLSVLELSNIQGKDSINADNPLAVNIQRSIAADEMIIPMGYDPETKMYFPLGFSLESGEIMIQSLPDESPVKTRSLFGSVKIFFQKIVLSHLGFEYKHPQLAKVEFETEGEEFSYQTDLKKIKAEVAQKQNIVIFIHGIIGDTTEMPKILRRIGEYNGAPFQNPYDLVLAFDYENLNTRIEQTAKDLKQRLESIGLDAGHSKKLTIIAHSMGGLVSRWFIEKEGGNQIVTRLVQVGTPNGGSPWSDVYQLSSALLTNAVNGAAFLQPYLFSLNLLGKFAGKIFITLQQMDPGDSEFLKELNNGADPGLSYTIVAGNTQLIPAIIVEAQKSLLKRVMARFKGSSTYKALDSFLFKEPNDIAVAVKSIYHIPGSEKWQKPPLRLDVGCDHLSYFGHPDGLQTLAKVVLEE